jgi:hypothetical protein
MRTSHKYKRPDFLGVGPERTGTTWIHHHLHAHPKILFPPLKEIRYFWEHANFPREGVIRRLRRDDSWHRRHYRGYLRRRLRRYLKNPVRCFKDPEGLSWDCRYLFRVHDDRWYLRCFPQREGFLCGDISPQYFFLPADEIRHIRHLLPEAKIIISLRRPDDWAWSFLRLHLRNRAVENDDGAIEAFLDEKIGTAKFSRALRAWKKHFPEEQLLVLFYDELCASPSRFYSRICDFLRIESDPARLPELAGRVNQGMDFQVPEKFRAKLEVGWRDDIEELATMLPDLPGSWLTAAGREPDGGSAAGAGRAESYGKLETENHGPHSR